MELQIHTIGSGPRHYDDIKISASTGPSAADCDDNDPKRHHPTMRTSFALLLRGSGGSQCGKARDELKTRFETGDILQPTTSSLATNRLRANSEH
jgi:hypothetical protein